MGRTGMLQAPEFTNLDLMDFIVSCYRVLPAELARQGLRYLATPDCVELAILAEGGPDAVALWRHCLRQGPNFRFHIEHCARCINATAPRVTRAFRALAAVGVAWHTPGERGPDGRLSGSHWNVSMLPRGKGEATPAPAPAEPGEIAPEPAPAVASPTPPQNRGSVNRGVTYKEDKDEHKTKTECIYTYTREAFKRLWAVYPQKANEAGALNALLAFAKRHELTPAEVDQYVNSWIANVETRTAAGEWPATGEYVPHLKTYIENRRWRDPPRAQVAAVRAAGLRPYRAPASRKTADVPLAEQLDDTSWAYGGAQEPVSTQDGGQPHTDMLRLAPSAAPAPSDEGSDDELERPRDSSAHGAQQSGGGDEPPRGPHSDSGRCRAVSTLWPVDNEPARPWPPGGS